MLHYHNFNDNICLIVAGKINHINEKKKLNWSSFPSMGKRCRIVKMFSAIYKVILNKKIAVKVCAITLLCDSLQCLNRVSVLKFNSRLFPLLSPL